LLPKRDESEEKKDELKGMSRKVGKRKEISKKERVIGHKNKRKGTEPRL